MLKENRIYIKNELRPYPIVKKEFEWCSQDLEPYKCKWCPNFEISFLGYMKQHIQQGHNSQITLSEVHKCRNCNFETNSCLFLIRHTVDQICVIEEKEIINNSIAAESNDRIDCFLNKKTISDRWYFCECCSFQTLYKTALKSHVFLKHPKSHQTFWFQCRFCSYNTFDKENLKEHISTQHSKSKKPWFSCDNCNYKTLIQLYLKQHVVTKHILKIPKYRFYCKRCRYKTFEHCSLRKHMKQHKSKNTIDSGSKCSSDKKVWFECEDCAYRTVKKSNLKKHTMTVHTSNEEKRWFQCEHCNYKTPDKSNLKKHVMTKHTLEEQKQWFDCEFCCYRTTARSNLRRHVIAKHTNLRS